MFSHVTRCGYALAGPFRDHIFIHPMAHRFFLLIMIATIAIIIIIKFLVAFLVYKDAVSKNIENRKIWFFIVFFTSILGVLFYFLFVIYQHKNNVHGTNNTRTNQNSVPNSNQNHTSTRICKNCGAEGDGKFCSTCGSSLL